LEKIEKALETKKFEILMDTIKNYKIKGFGKLALYDAACRVGKSRKIYPQKIYLHAGTTKGAKKFDLYIKRKKGKYIYLDKQDFPVSFQKMHEWQIEDYLCINKDKYNKFTFKKSKNIEKYLKEHKLDYCSPYC
jgi:hypothetical protein